MTISTHRWKVSFTVVGLLAFMSSTGVADVLEDHSALEEVIVVATKRATNEQQTPLSLTAFSAGELDAGHVGNLTDLALFTPGLFVGSDNGFGATTTAIRGFGPLNLSIGGDEAVGVYIDGVYQAAPYGNQFAFIDVDQIEVLRGPQGTLYGRNATGGAIIIDTVKPGKETVVKADISVGELNSYQGRALVSGAITDDGLSGKIAIGKSTRDGWATNPLLGTKLNGAEDLMTSAGLRWNHGGVWDLMANAHYGTQHSTLAAKNAVDGLPIDEIPANFPNDTFRRFYGATITATATLPVATFTSIAGYTNAHMHSLTSSANVGLTQYQETSASNAGYEELRLASNEDYALSWIIGLTGLQQRASDSLAYALTAAYLGSSQGLGLLFDNKVSTTSYAGFVEIGWKVTDKLRLTAGDRYTHDTKDWANCINFGGYTDMYIDYSPNLCEGKFNPESKSWSASTPKFVADYRLTDLIYAYASYTRGFRSGGWNFTSAVDPEQPYTTAFNPEYATSYEAGIKSEFYDRHLRVNLSGYLADYTDLQVRTVDPLYHLTGVHNAGAARVKGIEFQALAKPTPELTVSANVAWERALYTNFSFVDATNTLVNYKGNFLDNAPEWTYGLSAEYTTHLHAGGTLTPRIDASYMSHVYYTEANAAPFDAPGHEAINLQLRYNATSGHWGWTLYVDNVTDKQWRQYAYTGVGTVVGAYYAAPRVAGLRLFWNGM